MNGRRGFGRGRLAALCGVALALGVAAPAQAANPGFEPDDTFAGASSPSGGFEGPCGLTVDVGANIYVANYYKRAVDIFRSNGSTFATQITGLDPIDGPCGLAVDNSGRLYVNDFHRNVQRFTPAAFPLGTNTRFTAGSVIDSSTPTGVAVDPAAGTVFVNARDHIAVYDSSERHLFDIGGGTLRDGYGLAYSQFNGFLYVADAADNTVKIFSSLADTLQATITGSATPNRRFVSLRDSALAVDRITGEFYVTDATGSPLSERPEATVYVFDATGASYRGLLKYRISTASPPGLAVDNSAGATQGEVYVTSGITEQAVFYAYPRGSATSTSRSTQFSLGVTTSGSGSGSISNDWAGVDCDSSCEDDVRAGVTIPLTATPEPGSVFTGWSGAGCSGTGSCAVAMTGARSLSASFEQTSGPPAPAPAPGAPTASASSGPVAGASEISRKGILQVKVTGKLAPKKLPRDRKAPIKVSVGGEISTTDGSLPPQLRKLRIELNKQGRIDHRGLPTCKYSKIQPGSTSRAKRQCRSALVGQGSFTANITLSGQEPYPTRGKLLVFNGLRGRKPVLYGHIYSPKPFATSFVIVFRLQKLRKGTFGTALDAPLPKAMRAWGRLTGLSMTLNRKFRVRGKRHSYISSGCPAPRGFTLASFSLARTSFVFEDGTRLRAGLPSTCRVRR